MKTTFSHLLATFACLVTASALPPAQLNSRGIGAGGGMYYPVISPNNSLTMFLGCDMSELFYTYDGALSWNTVDFRQLQASTLTEVQYTNDPQILYALDWNATAPIGTTLNRPSRSADGGVHWSPCTNWPAPASCNTVYAAWNSTSRIFAGSASKLYTSNDSGSSFSVALDMSTLSTYNTSTKARLAGAFFDGSNVWIGSNCGLLYSNNSGDSFNTATVIGFNTSTESIVAFVGAKDPSTGTIRFYCITANSSAATAGALISAFYFQNPQIYRLDGSGSNWTATNVFSSSVRNGIAANDYPGPISMARNNINVVYIAANRTNATYPNNNTVYKLTSAGGAWASVFFIPSNQNIYTGWGGTPSNGRLDYAYPLGLGVDPNDANHVVACDDALIHQSTDGGANWYQVYVNPADQNTRNTPISAAKGYRGIGLEPTACYWLEWSDASTLCAGFSDMAIIRATDGGTKWFYPGGFAYDEVYQIIRNPANGILYCVNNTLPSPYFIFGNLSDTNYDPAKGAIYYSLDNGATWTLLKSYTAFGGIASGGSATGAAPVWLTLDAANDRLYVSIAHSTNGGIWRIDNVSSGAGASAPVKLTAPPRTQGHAHVLRILSNGELVCSYNGRSVSGTGFTQSSGVFYSTDGGVTWSDRSDSGMKYFTQEVSIDPLDENTWYACVWGTVGFTSYTGINPQTMGGIYKSTNRGVSWTRIYSGDCVGSVTFNPSANHTNEMYACARNLGLLYTSNLRDPNGATFTQVASFPFRQPTHVFYNPYNASELWVTSYGNGLRVGTIPAGSVQFSAASFSVTEGSTATITATRTGGDNGAISVSFGTANGTATANADYTSTSGSLSWADADTSNKTFTITTNLDQLVEGTETVNLSLTAPTNGATLGIPNGAVLSIADSALDNWRAAQFGTDANNLLIAGDNATPAHDGIPNLLKYALGLNPYLPAPGSLFAPVLENGYLTVSINRSAQPADVTMSAEVTSDLLTAWLPDTTIITNNAALFKARDNFLTNTNTRRFIHAVVRRH